MTAIAKIKTRMKEDPTLSKMILTSKKDEIFLDLDADRKVDLGLMDSVGDGRVDTMAVDLTGDNEFNLYFMDTSQDDLPDVAFYDEQSNGDLRLVGIGSGIEGTLQQQAAVIYRALLADEYDSERLKKALAEMNSLVKNARATVKRD